MKSSKYAAVRHVIVTHNGCTESIQFIIGLEYNDTDTHAINYIRLRWKYYVLDWLIELQYWSDGIPCIYQVELFYHLWLDYRYDCLYFRDVKWLKLHRNVYYMVLDTS